jgi:ankyrin repeat protein
MIKALFHKVKRPRVPVAAIQLSVATNVRVALPACPAVSSAFPNARTEKGGAALFAACREGQVEAARLRLENGADPNVMAMDGYTALMVASTLGQFEIATLLLEKGADPSIKAEDGTTALKGATTYLEFCPSQ